MIKVYVLIAIEKSAVRDKMLREQWKGLNRPSKVDSRNGYIEKSH
jgi:hypothetical protein